MKTSCLWHQHRIFLACFLSPKNTFQYRWVTLCPNMVNSKLRFIRSHISISRLFLMLCSKFGYFRLSFVSFSSDKEDVMKEKKRNTWWKSWEDALCPGLIQGEGFCAVSGDLNMTLSCRARNRTLGHISQAFQRINSALRYELDPAWWVPLDAVLKQTGIVLVQLAWCMALG